VEDSNGEFGGFYLSPSVEASLETRILVDNQKGSRQLVNNPSRQSFRGYSRPKLMQRGKRKDHTMKGTHQQLAKDFLHRRNGITVMWSAVVGARFGVHHFIQGRFRTS
jgi:hypothetical protein